MWHKFSALFIFLSLFSYQVGAKEPELRKIRVGTEAKRILQKYEAWKPISSGKGLYDYLLSEEDVLRLGTLLHQELGRCGGYMDITNGVIEAKHEKFKRPINSKPSEQKSKLIEEVSEDKIKETVLHLSSYPTRLYSSDTGVQAMTWLKEQFVEIAREAGRNDVEEPELVDHSSEKSNWIMPSLIVRVKGPDSPDESVILGGHADSINHGGGGGSDKAPILLSDLAPGSDDNASGVATVLETFRVLMMNPERPKKTMEFMAYSAEEIGLLGSQSIAKRYRNENRNVVAVMQFDMVMYPEPDGAIYLYSDYVDSNLTSYVKNLAEGPLSLSVRTSRCGYACSDHASWNSAGYPTVFPFEASMKNSNPNIHSENDTYENAPHQEHAAKFAKLAVQYFLGLAY